MINQEILEGLKYALAKGESLEKAMRTFHNAGYPEEEIKEAARALQIDKAAQGTSQVPKTSPQEISSAPVKEGKVPPKKMGVKQPVSSYQEPKKKGGFFRSKWFVIILAILLVLLILLLVGFFISEETISKLFV